MLLAPLGVRVTAIPLIRIEPPGDPAPLAAAAAEIERYSWVVVTSAHAAEALALARGAAPWPAAVAVAAVGGATARALAERSIPVAFVPQREDGAGLAAELAARESTRLHGARVLFPRSNLARRAVPDGLTTAGARVDEVEAYSTRSDASSARALLRAIERGELDAIVLTSPSSADALASAAGELFARLTRDVRLVAIGPVTSARLAELGRPADSTAEYPDPAGILAALRTALVAGENSNPRTGVS